MKSTRFSSTCLNIAVLILLGSLFHTAMAQNLIVQDTTITTAASFAAENIIAGPDVLIDNSGVATFTARNSKITNRFYVVAGGKFQVISSSTPVGVAPDNAGDPVLSNLPAVFALAQNYPNPFNPSTTIRFSLPATETVRLKIYNARGQLVRTLIDGNRAAGNYALKWHAITDNGHAVSSGIYFYRLDAGKFIQIRKMVLLR